MTRKAVWYTCVVVAGAAVLLLTITPTADVDGVGLTSQGAASGYVFDTTDPACQVATMVSTGGPAPRNAQTLAIRYAGWANYELAYGGQVILLDASFDRGPNYWPLGFEAADVKNVDAILIGHGHGDHMSDAAWIASRTGAVVVGSRVTTDALTTPKLDSNKVRTVTGRGGEVLEFGSIKVEPILTRHSVRDPGIHEHFGPALEATTTRREESAGDRSARQRRQSRATGPGEHLVEEGTIAYLITLDNGFTVFFRDSAGIVLDSEKKAHERIGGVDVGILAIEYTFLNELQAQRALSYMRVYGPAIFLPNHHDGGHHELWRSSEPIFQTIKDEFPDTITVSKQYREPVCIDTAASAHRCKTSR